MHRAVHWIGLACIGLSATGCGPSESERLREQQRLAAMERREAELRSLGTETPGVERVSTAQQIQVGANGWTARTLEFRRTADAQLDQAIAVLGEEADLIEQGRALFQSQSCMICHATTPRTRSTGPNLARTAQSPRGAWGSVRPLDGQPAVVLNLDYLNESLMHPRRRRAAGFGDDMPSYAGTLEPRDVVALGAYLRSLASEAPAQIAQTSITPNTQERTASGSQITQATPPTSRSTGSATDPLENVDRPLTPALVETEPIESSAPERDTPTPVAEREDPPALPSPEPTGVDVPTTADPPESTVAPSQAVLRASRPAWFFEGLRVDTGIATACIEVLSDSIAETRTLAVQEARARIASLLGFDSPAELRSDRLELVSIIPLPDESGEIRYAGYVLISAER